MVKPWPVVPQSADCWPERLPSNTVRTGARSDHWSSDNRRRARTTSGSQMPCWTVGAWVSKL